MLHEKHKKVVNCLNGFMQRMKTIVNHKNGFLDAVDKISNEGNPSMIRIRSLCIIGGIAALVAGILCRRNIAAEVWIFHQSTFPVTVVDWFELLQSNRTLGLILLDAFDLIHYSLAALMLLSLFFVLKHASKTLMFIAVTMGLVGITVYFSSNTAFSMLSLSNQYVTAAIEVKDQYLAAGQAMMAISRFGTGGYISLLLIAMAGMMISAAMFRSKVFSRMTAYVGVFAAAFDLLYCIAFVFVPSVENELLSIYFLPAAGLFLMVWHIMIGLRLLKLGRAMNNADES